MLYYQQQQKRLLALCDFVLSGSEDYLGVVTTIDEWLLDQMKPEIFDDGDPRNVLVLARKRFGASCAALAEAGYARAQELTVFDFNAAVDFLMSKHKAD